MEKDDLDYLLPSNGPNPYYDTWDRHNSIAFSTATKGLHNAPGENNCFVNSAVQVFWHLDVFRRSYRRLSGHTCMGNSCIFCALKVIFTQFQFSDQSSLHPDALRKALADTFANQQRFQLGHMDDAAECFENILKRIHFHIAHNHPEDTCNAPHCLPHQKFSLGIVEKVMCPCGASSKPLQYREMVHYISVSALVSQAQLMQESGDVLHPDRFGLLLRNANALGDIRQCPGSCGKTVQIRRTLLNIPDVVSIGLGWDSDHPTMEMTTKVARSIGTAILLQDVFHSVSQDMSILPKLQLVGLVCYYCKHYSTFVFHSKLGVWIYFDDTTVKEIGPSFDHVVEKCSRGRYQPLLLLYANPNSSAVPVDTAPKKRVMAPGFYLPGSEDENTLDRTHESISSSNSAQRTVTPNPEPSSQMVDPSSFTRARSVTPSSHHEGGVRKEAPSPSMCGPDHSRQQSFIMAMSKADPKNRHLLRMGGQSGMAGMPGPMTPVHEQEVHQRDGGSNHRHQQTGSAFHRPDHHDQHNTSYADYTLSNNNQYKRPSLTGFTPDDLPLTPNQKGSNGGDSPRKDSFKRNKEPIRADIIRHPSDSSGKASTCYSSNNSNTSNYQDFNTSQQQQLRANVRSSAMFYQGPGSSNPHFRQRSLSQGGDEAYASDSSEYSRPANGHVIVKPTAGGNMGSSDDKQGSYTHTAVQSGLATLPRKKKNQTMEESKNSQNSMMSANGGNSHNFRPVPNAQYYPREDVSRNTPIMDSSGLPPMGPGRVSSPLVDQVDSNAKKQGKDDTEKEKKLMKKVKKDSKKSEKKKMKSYPNSSAVETALMTRSASAEDDSLLKSMTEAEMTDEQRYINRKMVASVLKHQGLQRQPSTHSTNSQTSNSSVESEGIMSKLLAAKAHGDASFDNVSLGSHKDSGYGSSDRNSSSSTGSGTIDPSVQYFLSKSMVIPRNFNAQMFERQSQQFVTDFTAPTPHVYPNQHGGQGHGEVHDTDVQGQTMSSEDKNRHGYQPIGQRKVMHPIKESSQEDMLKIMPKEVLDAGKNLRSSPNPDSLQGKEGGRPPPIPPKNFAAFQVSKSAHQREPSIDSLDKDEVTNDYFVSMCEKADDLMDRCILAETQENLPDALRYCDSALGCLKEAMNQTDIEKKAAIYAQKKHKSCLLKSRSLFKRVSCQTSGDGHSGKRSSITSTDSDSSDKMVTRALSKERLIVSGRIPANGSQAHNSSLDSTGSARESPMPQVPEGMHIKVMDPMTHGLRYDSVASTPPSSHLTMDNGEKVLKLHVSRAQMLDRSDSSSNHSRSGSNSSVRSSVSVPSSLSSQQQPAVPTLPKSQSSIGTSSNLNVGSGPVPLDAYGTLSRNRKPRRTSDPTGKSGDSYQMFVNKQKQLPLSNVSDRGSTDSRDSDSSTGEGNPQRKTSKAEIRELLENNFVQQQKQQLISGPGLDQPNGVTIRSRHSYEGPNPTTIPSSSSNHQAKGQVITATQPSGRAAPYRYSTGGQGYPTQARHSPVPVSSQPDQEVMASPGVLSTSTNQAARLLTRSPTPHYPYHQQMKQQDNNNNTQCHHGRSHSQQHHIDNVSSNSIHHQRPSSLLSSPVSSSSSSQQLTQRPPSSLNQQQHYQPPPLSSVSGYTQQLPGHRLPPNTSMRPASSSTTTATTHFPRHLQPSSQSPNTSSTSYPHPLSNQQYLPAHPSSQSNDNPSRIPPHPNQVASMDHSRIMGSNPTSNNTHHQNLSPPKSQTAYQDPRRPGAVQPPPPPARTTSNPDFRVQLQQIHINNQSTTPTHQYPINNSANSPQLQQNIARVQPNSHLTTTHPSQHSEIPHSSSGGHQQDQSQTPHPQAHRYRPGSSTDTNRYSFASTSFAQGNGATPSTPASSSANQLKHAYSSTGLNTIAAGSMAPRPLERCTSQPDCQNLRDVDPYQSSERDGSSFPSPLSHQVSHPANTNTAVRLESGQSMRLGEQTSDSPDGMERQQSVKDLMSRFDQPNTHSNKPAVKPKPSMARNRSKSESGSKKPKSVLKSKKAKSGSGKNRKSVSFAQDFAEKASGYESAAELTSFSSSAPFNDRAYFSDDEEHLGSRSSYYAGDNNGDDVEVDSSNSDEAPPPEELACQLCHKREMETGRAYCSKCYFYMSRLTN